MIDSEFPLSSLKQKKHNKHLPPPKFEFLIQTLLLLGAKKLYGVQSSIRINSFESSNILFQDYLPKQFRTYQSPRIIASQRIRCHA